MRTARNAVNTAPCASSLEASAFTGWLFAAIATLFLQPSPSELRWTAVRALLFRGPCLIDRKGPSARFPAVQFSHRLFSLGIIFHGDQGETTRSSGVRISGNLRALNGPVGLEDRLQLGVGHAEREIADVKIFHVR